MQVDAARLAHPQNHDGVDTPQNTIDPDTGDTRRKDTHRHTPRQLSDFKNGRQNEGITRFLSIATSRVNHATLTKRFPVPQPSVDLSGPRLSIAPTHQRQDLHADQHYL